MIKLNDDFLNYFKSLKSDYNLTELLEPNIGTERAQFLELLKGSPFDFDGIFEGLDMLIIFLRQGARKKVLDAMSYGEFLDLLKNNGFGMIVRYLQEFDDGVNFKLLESWEYLQKITLLKDREVQEFINDFLTDELANKVVEQAFASGVLTEEGCIYDLYNDRVLIHRYEPDYYQEVYKFMTR